ncbi:tRNA preQ1(34) S-adenosylmethionine ribosyltransferase-isomerase QueA [PVC group bacterium (ex Bugula neritina AB1)]|nr:tRNA preQ1(34) S-adenosylmethionine ribosyltransferase-isomerase QueA [PVC group bacterium (ex Bugula neritina AB1)]
MTLSYNLQDYSFDLPEELIAQHPMKDRDQSRLLIYHSKTKEIEHDTFSGLYKYLDAEDLLVLNDTKVIPARLYAWKTTGGKIEIFLIRPIIAQTWLCMVSSSKKIKKGHSLKLSSDIQGEIIKELPHGYRHISFHGENLEENLRNLGNIPLPPYIKRELNEEDATRYQTIFASKEGAVAAPTAGLHFTDNLFSKLKQKGVNVAHITLHVGPGTFKKVTCDDIRSHHVDQEYFEISNETINLLKATKKKKKRVISVGTTTTRVLESLETPWASTKGWTNLYIRPPYTYKVIDSLITNFHLPQSSLLFLVSALTGHEEIKSIYKEAVFERYRFYSYGDAMICL